MTKQATAQTTISYRHETGTSKVSMQPAIFEALCDQVGTESKAREVVKELAISGREKKVKDVSLYVQSKVLISLMPSEIQNKVTLNITADNRLPLRYRNEVNKKMTKLTTFTVLHDILNVVYDGASEEIHRKFANDAHRAKSAQIEALGDSAKKTCDISHTVRERIITNLVAAVA